MGEGQSVTTRRRRWWLVLSALAVVAALAVAGCGGGDEEAAPPAPAPAEPAAEPPAEPAEPPAETTEAPAETGEEPAETGEALPPQPSVTDYAEYVGGSGAADPSLTPIKIGYINQEGGPIEIGKTADNGVEIGATFINEQAGGIGGHPVEIVTCFIAQAEEEGQQCGQQFANDPEIVAIVTGAVAIGSESLHAALASSKPVVVGVSVNAFDTRSPNTAILFGDSQYILAPYATFARDTLGVTSAALVYPEGAGLDAAAAGQASAFEAAGIPIEVVSFPANTPDLTVPLTAANAQDADLVMPVINPGDCVKFQQAILDLGIPEDKVLASPICLTPQTIEGLGDFPKWIYAIASKLTFDVNDPGVPEYQEILKSQGPEAEKYIGDPWTNVGFGEILTLAKWLNALGPDNITTEGVVEQMLAFTGPLALGSPEIQCGQYPEAPGVCNDHTQFYQYTGAETGMVKAGDWVPPPEGWVAPF